MGVYVCGETGRKKGGKGGGGGEFKTFQNWFSKYGATGLKRDRQIQKESERQLNCPKLVFIMKDATDYERR